MAKRMQEQKEENRIVAKSRPMVMNLTSSVATISSSVDSPIASISPKNSQSFKSTGWIVFQCTETLTPVLLMKRL